MIQINLQKYEDLTNEGKKILNKYGEYMARKQAAEFLEFRWSVWVRKYNN